jgi:AcrR family transcriptional regulator
MKKEMKTTAMEKNTEHKESRDRIIEAAEHVFAEKGFDGARVDEIARRAGVNKALIYYYFKSKDEILDFLFHKFIEKVFTLFDSLNFEDLLNSDRRVREVLIRFVYVLEEHRNLLRIFLMESLKDPKNSNFAENFIKTVIRFEKASIKKTGIQIHDEQAVLVLEFFTAYIPIMSYIVYKDLWCGIFKVSDEELRENFLNGFMNTHVEYSKTYLQNRVK